MTSNVSCLTALQVPTGSPKSGGDSFLSKMVQSEFCRTNILLIIYFLPLLTKNEHLPTSSQESTVFKEISKMHDSFVYLYFWLSVQMDNSWILEPTAFSNEIYSSNCQGREPQPSSFECYSWPLIALSQ